MTIEEIVKKALDGEAILFLGAGFSVGATNISGHDFLDAKGLCEQLIKEGNIDIEGEDASDVSDLGYISQRFLDEGNTKRDLIQILKNNYRCHSVSDEHKIIAGIDWKKVYTTNYDDVMEVASRELSVLREPVVATTHISEVYNQKKAVIHINGFVGCVNENNLFSTFKMTERSYKNSSISNYDWNIALRNDIQNAKSVVFIGYSLGYDLELQQIFSANEELKNKCLFVTFNPKKRTLLAMKSYGEVFQEGLAEFSKYVSLIRKDYDSKSIQHEFSCLKESVLDSTTEVDIDSDSIIRLLVDGYVDDMKVCSDFNDKYIVERDCIEKVIQFFKDDGKLVILHSDLANGKTIVFKQLEKRLNDLGTVYHLEKINNSLSDDLEHISSLKGNHFIFFENYNLLLDDEAWIIIKKYNYSNIKYVFTSRSYINDSFYLKVVNDLNLDYKSMAMYDLNVLTRKEIIKFVKYINKYNLWGVQSAKSVTAKEKYIEKTCKGEIRNLLLEIYKSDNVKKKINEIVSLICRNDTCRDVLLLAFIGEIMAIHITYDDIETILNYRVNELYFEQYKEIKELLLLDGKRVRFKSSSIATHIISDNDFNDRILDILKNMVNVLIKHTYNTRNETILKFLISFSTLRMTFNREDRNIKRIYIDFYENARKTQYFSKNPFFWIQYALAVMEISDYSAAEIYLSNASAFSKERFNEEIYHIESLKARLLLEKTIFDKDKKNAFENFQRAHSLICSNKTPERHYPYRQASRYVEYYKEFYKFFPEHQKVSFMYMCVEIRDKMNDYLNGKNHFERNNRKKNMEIESIMRNINGIIKRMAREGR